MVETLPVTEDNPPTFLCDGERLVFTGGTVTIQERALPRDRYLGIIKLRRATASDGETTYRAYGGARFSGTNDETFGTFSVRVTFVAPGGQVERVNSTFTFRDGEFSLVERGTCTVED